MPDFDKCAKAIKCKKDQLFNKWCWESIGQKAETSPLYKINSKWIVDLSAKCKPIKI